MLSVAIDWLEFTVLDSQLPIVLDTMGLEWEDFTQLPKGRFGYHNQYKWSGGNIYLMFTANNDKNITVKTKIKTKTGVHVMLTGQGCRQYAAKQDLLFLIRRLYVLNKRVNFTRIDLAIDDRESKLLDYDHIHDAAIAGNFTSRWSKWDEVTSRQTSTNEYLGRTMCFGSQASDLFCRVYDKSLERKKNSDEDIPTKWTRLEIVYRKDRATKLVEFLIKGDKPLGHALRGTLRQYLRFLTPITNDKNKARWPSVQWWEDLLAGVDKLQLTIKKEARTIEDMTAWVDKQIAPTIATIIKAQEGDMSWLRKIIVDGSTRLKQRHKDAIYQYLNKEGLAA